LSAAIQFLVDANVIDDDRALAFVDKFEHSHAFDDGFFDPVVLAVELDWEETGSLPFSPEIIGNLAEEGRDVVMTDVEVGIFDVYFCLVGLELREVVGEHQKELELVAGIGDLNSDGVRLAWLDDEAVIASFSYLLMAKIHRLRPGVQEVAEPIDNELRLFPAVLSVIAFGPYLKVSFAFEKADVLQVMEFSLDEVSEHAFTFLLQDLDGQFCEDKFGDEVVMEEVVADAALLTVHLGQIVVVVGVGNCMEGLVLGVLGDQSHSLFSFVVEADVEGVLVGVGLEVEDVLNGRGRQPVFGLDGIRNAEEGRLCACILAVSVLPEEVFDELELDV
jgi:hypothetical protein